MKRKRNFQIVVSVSTLTIEYTVSANSTPAQKKELDEAVEARFRENGFGDDWYKNLSGEELTLPGTPVDFGEPLNWSEFEKWDWDDFPKLDFVVGEND